MIPDAVQQAWDDAVAQWDEPAKHAALLGLVAQYGSYAWAAAKYKERAGDPIADKQLERLRTSAVAAMMSTSSKKAKGDQPYRSTIVLLAALLVLLVLGLVFTTILHARAQ
ncbi:MAG: hypothetical protein JO257_25980 [Deltaproteobacteria bacterium]|nr:hypothetical protein [Deltaproteobacteria bacterium]